MKPLNRFILIPLFLLAFTNDATGESRPSSKYESLLGLTFELPIGYRSIENTTAPIVAAWSDEDQTVNLIMLQVPIASTQIEQAIQELSRWPSSGKSMINGFGESNSRALEKSLAAKCNFIGAPKAFDPDRAAARVAIEVTCSSKAGTETFRYDVMQILTRKDQIMFRVESLKIHETKADLLAASLWHSLTTNRSLAVKVPTVNEKVGGLDVQVDAVSGGRGVYLRDYAQIRTAYLLGEYTGAILAGIVGTVILAFLLMRLGLGPLSSLIASQFVLSGLRAWGASKDGSWQIDPLLYLISGLISVFALSKWANGRWAKLKEAKLVK